MSSLFYIVFLCRRGEACAGGWRRVLAPRDAAAHRLPAAARRRALGAPAAGAAAHHAAAAGAQGGRHGT